MRPVNKGGTPQVDNADKTVSDYKDWRLDLLERIGNYCSYCNMVLNDSPQVEHVAPKSNHPELQLSWQNMLLACGPCNRAKSNHPFTKETHYMPDYHNTHLAFDYIIVPHPRKKKVLACIPIPKDLNFVAPDKVSSTISLFKLDAITSNPRATDLRWKYRYEAYQSSRIWRNSWDEWGHNLPDAFIPLLIDAALAKGFFSIWFDCFDDVGIIRKALTESFPGTQSQCFKELNDYAPTPLHTDDL